jgi:hypothetical protein
MKAISEVAKDDSDEAQRFVEIFKKEKQAEKYPITPREKLIASLPTPDKMERLMPEIKASSNPNAYISNLVRKRIISQNEAKEAFRIKLNINE